MNESDKEQAKIIIKNKFYKAKNDEKNQNLYALEKMEYKPKVSDG